MRPNKDCLLSTMFLVSTMFLISTMFARLGPERAPWSRQDGPPSPRAKPRALPGQAHSAPLVDPPRLAPATWHLLHLRQRAREGPSLHRLHVLSSACHYAYEPCAGMAKSALNGRKQRHYRSSQVQGVSSPRHKTPGCGSKRQSTPCAQLPRLGCSSLSACPGSWLVFSCQRPCASSRPHFHLADPAAALQSERPPTSRVCASRGLACTLPQQREKDTQKPKETQADTHTHTRTNIHSNQSKPTNTPTPI